MTTRGAATRYARALFDVARKEEADLDLLHRELVSFADTMNGHAGLLRALTSPAVPVANKRAVLEALLAQGGAMTPMLAKLLMMLADRDRLALVPHLVTAFEQRLMDHRQVVRAELSTAVTLPPDRIAALQEGLRQATGRDVRLETRVDASLIGGAVARIGSTVYDGSLTTQLQKLKQSLIESAQ